MSKKQWDNLDEQATSEGEYISYFQRTYAFPANGKKNHKMKRLRKWHKVRVFAAQQQELSRKLLASGVTVE